MGAYEFDNVRLDITGTFTPGGSMTFDVQGTAGLNALLFVGTAESAVDLYPIGALYLDFGQTWISFAWPAVPSNLTVPIPSLPPLDLVIQVVGFQPSPLVGNSSNPVSVSIQ